MRKDRSRVSKAGAKVKKQNRRRQARKAESDIAAWRRAWDSFLEGKITAGNVVDVVLRHWEGVARRMDESAAKIPGTVVGAHDRFQTLAKGVKADLVELIKMGANPGVILALIVYDEAWFFSDMAELYERRDSELRRLSSPAFWRKKMSVLERARSELAEFESSLFFLRSIRYGDLEESFRRRYPSIRLFEEIKRARETLGRLLTRATRLGLTEKNRVIREDELFIKVLRTEQDAIGMKGGVKLYDWGLCALGLSRYLEKRTGRPQWARIARMLHFAGLDEFPGALGKNVDAVRVEQHEVDKIRNRLKKLWKNVNESSINLHLASLEREYETRANLKRFDEGWIKI